jgi:hypothetical protein
MRTLSLALILIIWQALSACGSGDYRGIEPSEIPTIPNLEVSGNVYNLAVSSLNKAPAGAALANTPNSILNATARDIATLNPVSQGAWVYVDVTATNRGAYINGLTFETGIEDVAFRTRENWSCFECYEVYPSGTACNGGGWDIGGGYFYNAVSAPSLPTCDNSVIWSTGYCYDTFMPGLDCDSKTYKIEHTPAGSGLWQASGPINALAMDQIFFTRLGFAHSTADIRPGHLAWFAVKDTRGDILTQQFYSFDVTP